MKNNVSSFDVIQSILKEKTPAFKHCIIAEDKNEKKPTKISFLFEEPSEDDYLSVKEELETNEKYKGGDYTILMIKNDQKLVTEIYENARKQSKN